MSASVDGSVRLWDFSSLRNRTCNVGGQSDLSSVFGLEGVVFGHVWEGFTAKLGWVVFHPKQEMVYSVTSCSQFTLFQEFIGQKKNDRVPKF